MQHTFDFSSSARNEKADSISLEETQSIAASLIEEHLSAEWSFQLSNTRRRLGDCNYRRREIRISKSLIETGDRADVEETLRHELAHALVFERYPERWKVLDPHGPEWKAIAVEVGANPQATSSHPASDDQLHFRYVIHCPNCSDVWMGRHRRSKRVQQAEKGLIRCTCCNAPVEVKHNGDL